MYGANVVVFEGILAFCHAPLLKIMDLKIFVDTDSDIRLARRYVQYMCALMVIHMFYIIRFKGQVYIEYYAENSARRVGSRGYICLETTADCVIVRIVRIL